MTTAVLVMVCALLVLATLSTMTLASLLYKRLGELEEQLAYESERVRALERSLRGIAHYRRHLTPPAA